VDSDHDSYISSDQGADDVDNDDDDVAEFEPILEVDANVDDYDDHDDEERGDREKEVGKEGKG
jgi:hypothetical protein